MVRALLPALQNIGSLYRSAARDTIYLLISKSVFNIFFFIEVSVLVGSIMSLSGDFSIRFLEPFPY
jgi:hypothetical protein